MNTQIRIGHVSPDSPSVNVVVDGSTLLENVDFGQISDIMDVESGSHHVAILPSSGGDPLLETTLELEDEIVYTVLAIEGENGIDAMVLADEFETMETDDSVLRFVHLSPDAPAVDLRIAGGPTLFESIAFGEATHFVSVDVEGEDISVLPAGEDDVVLTLSDLTLESGMAYTAYAIGTLADETLDVLLVADDLTDVLGRTAPTR